MRSFLIIYCSSSLSQALFVFQVGLTAFFTIKQLLRSDFAFSLIKQRHIIAAIYVIWSVLVISPLEPMGALEG